MSRWAGIIALCMFLAAVACGTETAPFAGAEYTPSTGVSPYKKVDINKEEDLTQPFILFPGYDRDAEYMEPEVLKIGDKLWMWFELARFDEQTGELTFSAIYLLTSYDGMLWDYANGGLPVLTPSLDWEEGHIGAPAVIRKDDGFYMWYCAARGKYIGLATSTDGINWTKHPEPVLLADQRWEEGHVCSPAVVHYKGKFRMWYSGGSAGGEGQGFCAGKAIGYAESGDGINWTKRDGKGHSSASGDEVEPVLVATQSWEAGVVGYPSVKVEQNFDRKIYKMWYTGQVPGSMYYGDASIGFAGSEDGLKWEKAPEGINPILQERFSIHLPGISNYLPYDESQPVVVRLGEFHYMWFVQLDALSMLTLGRKGISLATCPPLEGF